MVATEHIEQFRREGYVIARGLFSKQEADFYIDHYMRLREAGSYPGDFAGVDPTSNDPLKRYPRMIHMHRWDEVSLKWLIDPRLNAVADRLTGQGAIRGTDDALLQAAGCARTSTASGQLLFACASGHVHGGVDGAGSVR
jgi:hypothetical protein